MTEKTGARMASGWRHRPGHLTSPDPSWRSPQSFRRAMPGYWERMQTRFALICLALLVSGCGLTSSGSPGETPSPSVPASASSTGSPAVEPTPAASGALESPTPSTAPAGLTVEGFASVVANNLNMRRQPGLKGDLVTAFCYDSPSPCAPLQLGGNAPYSELYLLDGPVQADGYAWYLGATVSPNALTTEYIGWVAAGDESGPWLVSQEPDCPQHPIHLSDLIVANLSRFEAIACFGGEELAVRGWYVDLPADAEPPGQCSAEPAWLVCGWGYHMLRPQPSGWYGDANNLHMKVDPASNVQRPPRGNWVTVTGMFDHPAAQDCGSSAQQDASFRLMCRMEFVITSARLAE